MNDITGRYGGQELAARLRRVRLDLMPVLHELLRTRSVTRTAQSFGMTQPAISRALRQLRETFDDPLLVSPGRNGRLTPRAEALLGPLGRALAELDLLMVPDGPFDPAREPVHLSISTADYVTQLLAPVLSEICAREAPHVVLEFTMAAMRHAEDLGKVDFMIGPRAFGDTLGRRIGRLPLWRDEIVCIAARDRAGPGGRITPDQFQALRYAAFRRDPHGPAEVRALLQPTSPLEIAPVCTVPNFLVLGAIVEKTDCVALVPRKVARELERTASVRLVELAWPDREIFIDACWSPATEGRRGRAWFRDLLARAAARLA